MIIKTKEFQEACKTISMASDALTNLELNVKENNLYLNVTNKEYYVGIRYELAEPEVFRTVVNAKTFLELISGITTEEFSITIKENAIEVKAGKSKYKLPMIFENDTLMILPKIKLENKTVEMPISNDILKSIININSKELQKTKNIDTNELQKLYYITEEGCFSFSTGACLNSFSLEKSIKLLLNDRVVKLFKLFKEDVNFSFGHDILPNGSVQAKAIFETPNVYVAAIVTDDEVLLNKIQGPFLATKNFIAENYTNKCVLSVNELLGAIQRLMAFTKNSITNTNSQSIFASIKIENDEFTITDKLGNSETVPIENGSFVDSAYDFSINISDVKLVLESCKDEHITFNCGNGRTVVITRGKVANLIPEGKR